MGQEELIKFQKCAKCKKTEVQNMESRLSGGDVHFLIKKLIMNQKMIL